MKTMKKQLFPLITFLMSLLLFLSLMHSDAQLTSAESMPPELSTGLTEKTDSFHPEMQPISRASATDVVYSNDFEGTVGSEWSSSATDTTPSGRQFLGRFGNNTVSLSLANLPPHMDVIVSFDLFIIQSWDGNGPNSGPDVWDLSVAGGATLLHSTFSNTGSVGNRQAYPDAYPGGDHAARTGAAESNTLGYSYHGDSIYQLNLTFPHSADALVLDFSASGLQSLANESWGVDNVEVKIVPYPTDVVYSNDFEGTVGSEWSSSSTDTTPSGRQFLGQFGNNTVSLSLANLPPHMDVMVSFDLFIIQSWDGNGDCCAGPDVWDLSVAGGATLLHSTFSNTGSVGNRQAYPDAYPGGDHAARTGAAESNTLGYSYHGDSIYQLNLTFPHSADALVLDFSASGLQDLANESWGVDNVEVSIVDPTISDVRTTNIRDVSFTVSWLTDIAASGELRYGTEPNNLNQTADDLRGAATSDDTHIVMVNALQPNTTYYFDVVSGSATDNNDGTHYSVTTGSTLGVPGSDTIYGQVLQSDGSTLAVGTIVYITLQDVDGVDNNGEAAPLSALVDESGYWFANLADARLADLSNYFNYSASGDQIRLEAQGAADGHHCGTTVDTADDSPATALVLSNDPCTISWTIDLELGWNNVALPLVPTPAYMAEGVCSEVTSQGGTLAEIDRWNAGGWSGHICGLPFNDFSVELANGYFMKSNSASSWTIEGLPVTAAVPFNLQVGWNSISVPHTDGYTAESLCDDIISQGVTAVEIDRWFAGGWSGHICGLSFNDFALERDKGYFVKTSSAGTVTPSLPASLPLQAAPTPPRSPDNIPAGASLPVRNLRLSNLRDSSVTLSWLTDEATTGYVQFGSPPSVPPNNRGEVEEYQVAYDSREATTSSTTHDVVLDNLTPETTYHFEIVSGAEVSESGTFSTLSSLESVPESETIYGQVFWANGTTPAASTLVYITLQDRDGAGSEGEAGLLSAIVDKEGYWHANLANARLAEGGEAFSYSETGDVVVLTIPSDTDSSITTLDTSQLHPAPRIMLDEGAQRRRKLYLPLIGNSKQVKK